MRELETPAPISKRKIMAEPTSENLAAAVILVPYITEEAESFVERISPLEKQGKWSQNPDSSSLSESPVKTMLPSGKLLKGYNLTGPRGIGKRERRQSLPLQNQDCPLLQGTENQHLSQSLQGP